MSPLIKEEGPDAPQPFSYGSVYGHMVGGVYIPREFKYNRSPKRKWTPKQVKLEAPKPGEIIVTNHRTFACGDPCANPEQGIPVEDNCLVVIGESEKAVKVAFEMNGFNNSRYVAKKMIRLGERMTPNGVLKIVEAMPKWLAKKVFPEGYELVKQEFQIL